VIKPYMVIVNIDYKLDNQLSFKKSF